VNLWEILTAYIEQVTQEKPFGFLPKNSQHLSPLLLDELSPQNRSERWHGCDKSERMCKQTRMLPRRYQ